MFLFYYIARVWAYYVASDCIMILRMNLTLSLHSDLSVARLGDFTVLKYKKYLKILIQ
jgi:hypothetical protein